MTSAAPLIKIAARPTAINVPSTISISASPERHRHHYDTTGNMITKVLSKKLRADARITKHSITAIVDLIKRDGRIVGAWGVDYDNGTLVIYHAQQIILSTGGGSGLFYVNDNPQVTGDGYVLGFRAGVPLLDF
jgi:aspartate oxidase